MKTSLKIVLIAGLTLLPVTGVVIYGMLRDNGTAGGGTDGYTETDWRMLRRLDYASGEKPPELAALDGKSVKIPGFVVPLDDNDTGLSEFLLVPSPQACIHVPPPPPNQMVMVRMKSGKAPQRSWGPVWIKGRLHIATMDSQYGKISYMMHGDEAEPYRMPEDMGTPPPPPPAAAHSPPAASLPPAAQPAGNGTSDVNSGS